MLAWPGTANFFGRVQATCNCTFAAKVQSFDTGFTRPATRRPRRTPSSPPPRHLAPGQSTPRTPPCRCSSRRRSIRPRRSCCRGNNRGRPGRGGLGNLAWAGSSSHCRSRTRSGSRRGYRSSVRGRSRPSSSCTGRTGWPASAGSARACRSPSCRPGSGSRIVGLRTAPAQLATTQQAHRTGGPAHDQRCRPRRHRNRRCCTTHKG